MSNNPIEGDLPMRIGLFVALAVTIAGAALIGSTLPSHSADLNCQDPTKAGCACHEDELRLEQNKDPDLQVQLGDAVESCIASVMTSEHSGRDNASQSMLTPVPGTYTGIVGIPAHYIFELDSGEQRPHSSKL